MALKTGQQAPDFTLSAVSGIDFRLSQTLAGKACILYFYPKDFTSVCTAEACQFRDMFEEFRGIETEVIGISRDDIATHSGLKASTTCPLNYSLTPDGTVCKLYDALVPILRIPKRITYLLDSQHTLMAVYDNMFSPEHATAILKK